MDNDPSDATRIQSFSLPVEPHQDKPEDEQDSAPAGQDSPTRVQQIPPVTPPPAPTPAPSPAPADQDFPTAVQQIPSAPETPSSPGFTPSAPAYGQTPTPPPPPAYGQTPSAPVYGQAPAYGQTPPAPGYGQASGYGQAPAYGQDPAYGQSAPPPPPNQYGAPAPNYQPPYQQPGGYPQQPQPYGYGYGYGFAKPPTNGLAIASLICGIFWLWGVGSILALIFGFISMKQIKQRGEGGRGMSIAGIILGGLGIIGLIVWIIFVVALVHQAQTIPTYNGG